MPVVIEELTFAEDIDNEDYMKKARARFDAAARNQNPQATLTSESIDPYIIVVRRKGQDVALPETEDTKRWRVLRRIYA